MRKSLLSDQDWSTARRLIWSAALRLARPGIEADDLAQEGWLAILTGSYPGEAVVAWPTWVFQRARVRMRDAIAHRQHRRMSELPEVAAAPASEGDDKPVLEALRRLSDLQARIVTLVAGLDGAAPRSTDAVAHMMGRDRSGTDRAWRRARSELRAFWGERAHQ